MHQGVVGLLPCVEQEVERPAVLIPLDGCGRPESAGASHDRGKAGGEPTSLLREDLLWVLKGGRLDLALILDEGQRAGAGTFMRGRALCSNSPDGNR